MSIRWGDNLVLWFGLLGGPAAWFLQLVTVYALTVWACAHDTALVLHGAELACLLLAAGGGWTAFRSWRSVGGWPSDKDEGKEARIRLLSVVGLMSGALFTLVILASWIAVALLNPCPV